MDNEQKNKIQAWNLDGNEQQKFPELQNQQSTVSWTSVGESMAKDTRENFTLKWYFNVPVILGIALIAIFISRLIAIILVLIFMGRIIWAIARNSKSPYKNTSIIWWGFMGFMLLVFILAIPVLGVG
jgi:Ca2+-dependent lipid-binding protein